MSNLDTSNGLPVPTMAQITQSFVTAINENIDSTFAIQNANILAQIIVIFSQELSNLFDTLQNAYAVLDPQTAEGDNLDDAAQYVGVSRTAAAGTRVYLLLSSETDLTTIPALTQITASNYTVSNENKAQIDQTAAAQVKIKVLVAEDAQEYAFTLDEYLVSYTAVPSDTVQTIATNLVAAVLADAALFTASIDPDDDSQLIINKTTGGSIDYSQSFNAQNSSEDYLAITSISTYTPFDDVVTGDISIPAGTFDDASVPISGVTCLQPDDGINGNAVDSDQQLRLKRVQSLAMGGARTPNAIESELNDTDYVKTSQVYQNKTDDPITLTGGIELLPHSIYAVVLGGYKQDIGTVIYNKMSEGIQTNGDTIVALTDNEDNIILIQFDYADQISVKVYVNITVDRSVLYKINKDVVSNAQQAVYEYINGLSISETMYTLSIQGAALCQVGFGVISSSVSYNILPSPTVLTSNLVPNANQIVVANLENIVVTVSAS